MGNKTVLDPHWRLSMEKEIHADLEQFSKNVIFIWTVPSSYEDMVMFCSPKLSIHYSDINYELEADASFWKQLLY